MLRLINIQNELKCNKSQYNSFGKYSYRSCEDILEAVKPLLLKQKCSLILKDDMVNMGDRFYVKAEVSLYGDDGVLIASTSAYAREDEIKKGMDGSQITGAASSYARKYALNGLFCIDDTKDADATNTHGKDEDDNSLSPNQLKVISEYPEATLRWICDNYHVDGIVNLTRDQAAEIIKVINKKKKAAQ